MGSILARLQQTCLAGVRRAAERGVVLQKVCLRAGPPAAGQGGATHEMYARERHGLGVRPRDAHDLAQAGLEAEVVEQLGQPLVVLERSSSHAAALRSLSPREHEVAARARSPEALGATA